MCSNETALKANFFWILFYFNFALLNSNDNYNFTIIQNCNSAEFNLNSAIKYAFKRHFSAIGLPLFLKVEINAQCLISYIKAVIVFSTEKTFHCLINRFNGWRPWTSSLYWFDTKVKHFKEASLLSAYSAVCRFSVCIWATTVTKMTWPFSPAWPFFMQKWIKCLIKNLN